MDVSNATIIEFRAEFGALPAHCFELDVHRRIEEVETRSSRLAAGTTANGPETSDLRFVHREQRVSESLPRPNISDGRQAAIHFP